MAITGTVELIAKIDTNSYLKGASDIDKANKGIEKSTENTSSKGEKSWGKMGVAIGAVAGIVQTVFTKAMQIASDAIGGAVKRVDTLNNADRVFANMGFAAQDTQKAMTALNKNITGLPTSLSDAVQGVQMLSGTIGDVGKSEQAFTALNTAILGSRGTAALSIAFRRRTRCTNMELFTQLWVHTCIVCYGKRSRR